MSDHAEKAKLAAWLHEWRLHQTLGASDDALTVSTGVEGGFRPTGAAQRQALCHSELRTGDILLLKPVTSLTRHRPVYVAALHPEGPAGWWRVAPFGRLSLPATPEEVETGLKAQPLRVLCLWNGHVVSPMRLLLWAWPVGRMAKAARMSALAASPASRGPRLIHPLDPRHAYLDEERALWKEWDQAARAVEGPVAALPPGAGTDLWQKARAAETQDDRYGK